MKEPQISNPILKDHGVHRYESEGWSYRFRFDHRKRIRIKGKARVTDWLKNKWFDIKLCLRILFTDEVLTLINDPILHLQEAEESLSYASMDDLRFADISKDELITDALENIQLSKAYLCELTGLVDDAENLKEEL